MHRVSRLSRDLKIVVVLIGAAHGYGQPPGDDCVQSPSCVSRIDDSATVPVRGMLRFAVQQVANGGVVTFAPALNGQTIKLDSSSPNNHIKITRDLTIQGPGSNLLTISGSGKTRILFIVGGTVRIDGLTLADGLGR